MTPRRGSASDLPDRLREHVRRRGLLAPGDHVLVAVSGGLDSVVLLHLLRFRPPAVELSLTVAHLDHRMRPGSQGDARWVIGLARAWDVPLELGVADPAPENEADARTARYCFLRAVAARRGVDRVATAHQADDQAETVLHRAVRGTGITGLQGIRERGPGGLIRPLLPFWRTELEDYGRQAGLAWRADPSNEDPSWARNVLRHEIIPRLEDAVAPGARRALARLARLARQDDEAWGSLLPDLLNRVTEEVSGDRIVVARPAFLAYHSAVRARVVRALARRLGRVLDEAGTRAALEFTTSGPSGHGVDLAAGLTLRRDFDRLVLSTVGDVSGKDTEDPENLVIPDAGPGCDELRLGGRGYRVRWERGERTGPWTEEFPVAALVFPLVLRGWLPGDRIRLGYGSKKLKKLFAEARVPVPERGCLPVLVDATGEVLWVPGLARSARITRDAPGETLIVGIEDADTE